MASDTRSDPPFLEHYRAIFCNSIKAQLCSYDQIAGNIEECKLPLIDLGSLRSGEDGERQACMEAIGKASSEWGFFQVLNHGISSELLKEMRQEQKTLFEMPFEKKVNSRLLNDSYRWGTPTAKSLQQLSWSEAFHVPLAKISEGCCYGEFSSLRYNSSILHTLQGRLLFTYASKFWLLTCLQL